MDRRVYDIANLLGTSLASAGVWLNFGPGWGLTAAGGLVIALNIVSALLASRG